MKKTILPFLFLLLSFGGRAAEIDSMFVEAPFHILPHLPSAQRLQLLELMKAGKRAVVKNAFGDTCAIEARSVTYLRLRLSSVSTLEMKLIGKEGKRNYLLLCETCCATACDSRLSVYNDAWQEVKMKQITQRPTLSDFLKNKEKAKKESMGFMPLFIRAELEEESDRITFVLDAESVLDKAQWKEWRDDLQPTLVRPIVVNKK